MKNLDKKPQLNTTSRNQQLISLPSINQIGSTQAATGSGVNNQKFAGSGL